jgi:hypothetical protein
MTNRRKPSVREIRLPCYGMIIRLAPGATPAEPSSGRLVSNLKAPGKTAGERLYNAAIDGLESLILAHACAGIDVNSAAYLEGIETAVDSAANHLL